MTAEAPRSLLIAAPQSGAGKTTVTLALLRALRHAGRRVVSAKSGPDYIDPKFHQASSGVPCINLDAWAMRRGQIGSLACSHAHDHEMLLIEGAMGLFDGAANGKGSAGDLAACLGSPVVLVIDCARQAQSVAALVSGFQNFRQDVTLAGLILNRVGSTRHEKMLRAALKPVGLSVFGALPRLDDLILPERHLGLVQAEEHSAIEDFLDNAASLCSDCIDLDLLYRSSAPMVMPDQVDLNLLQPLGQRIAVARDISFAFSYPHLLDCWQKAGAELSFFSPLEDEIPDVSADAIYLPGGYPELHAGKLASAAKFKQALRTAEQRGVPVYGECGGYMVLGEGLIDTNGARHEMLGLLPLVTSFADRKRHLGYRVLKPLGGLPWSGALTAHEFHYASIVQEGPGERLFGAEDAEGNVLADMGLRVGQAMGSFAHVISRQ